MENILTAATVVTGLVLGVTALVKKAIPDNKWLPFINILVGVILSVLYAFSFVPESVVLYAWGGLVAGLAAGGFYDLGANGVGLVNQKKSNDLINDGLGKQDLTEDGE